MKEKRSIAVIGLSVHTAPVEMREKLAVPEALWPRAIDELCNLNHIEEAAVLSTCNRMEIYVVALSWHRGIREVTEWMSKVTFFFHFKFNATFRIYNRIEVWLVINLNFGFPLQIEQKFDSPILLAN